jgi:hypothetical protein
MNYFSIIVFLAFFSLNLFADKKSDNQQVDNVCDIIKQNKPIYDFIVEKIKLLQQQTYAEALKNLKSEKQQFIKNDKLNDALAVKKLIDEISNNEYDTNSLEKYPDSASNIIQKFIQRIHKINNLKNESILKLKNRLIKKIENLELNKNVRQQINDYLYKKNLDFDNLCIHINEIFNSAQKQAQQIKVNKENSIRSLNEKKLIKDCTYPLANNLLAVNPKSIQGKIIFTLAESSNTDNKKISELRKNIEQKEYISIIPAKIDLKGFIANLENFIKHNMKLNEKDQFFFNCCASLILLNPKTNLKSNISKNVPEKILSDFRKKSETIFAGNDKINELQLEILDADPKSLKIVLQKIDLLIQQYPNNLSLKMLRTELNQKISKLSNSEFHNKNLKQNSKIITSYREITCTKCHGKKNIICPQCIGTGKCTEKITCNKCNGKGKNWLGIKCAKCNGNGYLKSKTKCLNCNGSGYILCPKCNGTGKLKIKTEN